LKAKKIDSFYDYTMYMIDDQDIPKPCGDSDLGIKKNRRAGAC
jgi:hypothetical protein